MNKKVISIVLNNFTNDSRVLKEAISLQKGGYKITVIALHENSLAQRETINTVFLFIESNSKVEIGEK